MATIRLCDLCGNRMKPEDDVPYMRALKARRNDPDNSPTLQGEEPETITAVATLQIYNTNNHPLTDICNECKLRVVTDGQPYSMQNSAAPVATLHPQVAHDMPMPVKLFTPPPQRPSELLSPTPPTPPEPERVAPTVFEPSLPGDRPNPRVG